MQNLRKHRFLAVMMALVMVISMLPVSVLAADPSTAALVTITQATDITAGTYFISGTSSKALDDGTTSVFMSTTDSTATRLMSESLTVTDGTVTSDAANCMWELIETTGGFYVKNVGNGKYLYYGTNTGNNIYQTEDVASAGVWTVVANDTSWTLQEVASGRQLSCNRFGSSGAYYLGFTAYTDTSSTARSLEFYKIGSTTTTPTEPPSESSEPSTPSESTDPSEPEEPSTPVDPDLETVELVTDVSELAAGDDIVIVAADYDYAMSATQKSNNRDGIQITKSADGTVVSYGTDVQVMTLEAGTANGTFSFFVGTGYLQAASSTANQLRIEETKSDNSSWTIEIDAATGVATVKAAGTNTRNWLRYNPSSTIFACYASGQKDIKIYKVPTLADPIPDSMIGEGVLNIKEANAAAATNVTVIGQVVYHYGNAYNGAASINSIILEDVIDGEIVGFQVYDYTNYANYKVGDIVQVTGNIVSYKGVMQMSSPSMEVIKTGADPIPAQIVTVSQLGADYLSEYVCIKNVTLGEYNATGNTTVTDSTGTINLYKGAPLDSAITVSDVTGVYGCCSAYNTTYQLRNGTSADYISNITPPDVEGMPAENDVVVIYNISANGVLALQDDNKTSPSVESTAATLTEGTVTAENGALIFTVSRNGDYYRFYNETFGYLCSNGTGSNAFYQTEASDDADWLLAAYNGGFTMESRTAKYNGLYSQYLEYYAGSYKTYSMYNVTDKDIYTFQFYPCANTNITAGVVNAPAAEFGAMTDAYIGLDYSFSFTVDAPFGVKTLAVACGETTVEPTVTADGYSVTIPAEAISGTELVITITGKDNKDVDITGTTTVTVQDAPVFTDVTPVSGSQTMDDKRPTIAATLVNGGENPTITMMLNETEVTATYADGVVSYTAAEDMADGRVTVTITATRSDGKTATKVWSFTVGKANYQLYFGQLHSHTTYSDGSGTLESALDYVAALPESANVDFVAFTDHSNYFDKSGEANPEDALFDMTKATAYSQTTWATYKDTIAQFNQSQSNIVAIGGFEMTWSGGPGHINTFNTPGIVSRNNTTLNNKTSDAGMKSYYALISRPEGADSISQFNHPGSTFGTFSDFAYWDAVLDTRIHLVEVGNGEGQIGEGGYYPSYEYYTMALDKGWHVAPTNNQDNHKGKWGNGNDARDVVITDDFSEAGIYEAIRNYRVYATEDKNLEIVYTVNDLMMGSMISETPEMLNISVTVADPDATDSISKVEVIVNSGKTVHTWNDPAVLAAGNLTCELSPNYSYYYIRVTQGDGDLAVTAPVWVGETMKLGISSVECGTSTPVTKEELTITSTLFNSETTDATVKALTYSIKGGEVLGVDTTGYTIPASGTLEIPFRYTPTEARIMTITVTAVVEFEGEDYTFTMDVNLDVLDSDQLVYVGIDASHYNEYVNGNYKDSMGNFSALAAGYSVRTVNLNTSADLIAACSNPKFKALILTAPSRRLAEAQTALLTYTEDEIAAIKAFNDNGGIVILAGWSDNYENYPSNLAGMTAEQHMAATQNALLEALGSSLRISDDATYDDSLNGGQAYRLYFSTYNEDSFLVDGVIVDPQNPNDRLYSEVFSQYGGATIHVVDADGMTSTLPSTVTPVVFGHSTTYSVDVDGDGLGGTAIPKYTYAEGDDRLLMLATEQLENKGLIVVSGAAFMSNFEVQATIEDSAAEKNYSNYKICQNLLAAINPIKISTIAEVHAQEGEGYKYTIEGVVTSNASGYDKSTAFFDCIYLQDSTAGINAFPVAGNFKIGDKVRITGTTSSYNGERQIAVTKIELIGEGTPIEPTEITAASLNDGSMLGSLIMLKGTVKSFALENGLVQTIIVEDAAGNEGRVFIDGYITTDADVANLQVGCEITAIGLASYDNSFDGVAPRIRIRNRADIVCGEVVNPDEPDGKFDIDFAQVILGNALNVNFAFPADAQDDWTSCYAVATKTYADGREDLTVTVPVSEWKTATINEKAHYYFSFSNVSGKEMADNIYVTIYNAEGEAISNQYTESIRSYVMRILDDQDAETRTMLVDMLNYGSAAQTAYAYGTDDLANGLLSETQKAYGSSTVKTCTDSRVKGANYQGTRLVLKNSILMQFGFEGLTADMTAKVEFTNHRGAKVSETVAPVKLDNGAYAIEVNQIVAADGRIPVTVTVYDADGNVYGTATDSMESYLARMGTTDPLYAAIMMFSDAAYAYLH